MISPLDRARMLDAEMKLQRAWLELSLREMSAAARNSPWAGSLNIGKMGMSFLKHRSLWVAGLSILMKMFRRRAQKDR